MTDNYRYKGCYKDKKNTPASRILSKQIKPQDKPFMSLDACAAAALKDDAKFFGMQWWEGDENKTTGECWMGNKLRHNYGSAACEQDDQGRRMGGILTSAIYKKLNAPKDTPTELPTDMGLDNNVVIILGVVGLVLFLVLIGIVIYKLIRK